MELTVEEILRAVEGQLIQGSYKHCLKGVSTDSRVIKAGELFIALKGERFDAHRFINDTLARGASGLIVRKGFNLKDLPSPKKDIPLIQVEDTLKALGDLACFWRQRNKATIVAITGSNGKTTTREMAATILEHSHRVLKPEHNWNNLIGLPLTLLRLEPHHEVAIMEMGMNRKGEIKRLSQIAKPHVGLITNISPVHLLYLKTLQNVAQAKGELFDSLTSENYAVINTDDPLIVELSKLCPAQKITFGINTHAQVIATDISTSDYSTYHFTLGMGGKGVPIKLKIPGTHTVYNALAAASIATIFKLTLDEIKAALDRFTAFPARMEIITIGKNISIINDTYNANPKSMESALRTLAHLKGRGRGIAVLGDMLELGEASLDFHQQVGSLIKALNLDAVFLIGTYAEVIAESACAQGVSEKEIHIGKTHEQIAQQLIKKVKKDDWILFKGSREMKIEKILEQFLRMRNKATKTSSLIKTVTMNC
jgi:UDP-N-acetylmuramoyl-tripeptide--D-alanyl-D-alanine ligase